MSSYFGTVFEVSKDPNDPARVRLSVRSSECRVDEYSLYTSDIEFLLSNQGSTVWATNGVVSIKYQSITQDVRIRFIGLSSSVVYVAAQSALQLMSGQYLDAMRG